MDRVSKIVICLVLLMFLVPIVVNAPLIPSPNGYTTTCNSKGCTNSPIYESILETYAPCLFGCLSTSSVQTVTLSSMVLYRGVTANASTKATSSLEFSLNNPGSATTITSITLTGSNFSPVTIWDEYPNSTSSTHINFGASYLKGGENALPASEVTAFSFCPWTNQSETLVMEGVFNYIINFANGQSVSGSSIAE